MNMYSTDGFTQSEVVYMPANYAFMQLHTLNNATSCVTHLTVLHSFVLFLTQSIIRLQTSWKTLHKSHVEQYFYQQSLTRTTFKIPPICKHKRPIDTLQQTSKTHCWNKDPWEPWSRWFVLTGMQIPILLLSNLHPIPPVSFTTFPKGKAYKKSIKADTIMISCRISFWRTSGGLYLRHKEDRDQPKNSNKASLTITLQPYSWRCIWRIDQRDSTLLRSDRHTSNNDSKGLLDQLRAIQMHNTKHMALITRTSAEKGLEINFMPDLKPPNAWARSCLIL